MTATTTTVGIELELSEYDDLGPVRGPDCGPSYDPDCGPDYDDDRSQFDSLCEVAQSTGWSAKCDASCGYELVSPVIKTYEDLEKVDQVIKSLRDKYFRVCHRCGFHVHLGVDDSNRPIHEQEWLLKMVMFMAVHQNAFYKLAPGRRRSKFCRPFTSDMKKQLLKLLKHESTDDVTRSRYYWLNTMAYYKHGTLEIRLMPGTLNAAQVKGWIYLLLYIVGLAKNGELPSYDSEHVRSLTPRRLAKLLFDREPTWPGGQELRKKALDYFNQRLSDIGLLDMAGVRRKALVKAWNGGEKFRPVFVDLKKLKTF